MNMLKKLASADQKLDQAAALEKLAKWLNARAAKLRQEASAEQAPIITQIGNYIYGLLTKEEKPTETSWVDALAAFATVYGELEIEATKEESRDAASRYIEFYLSPGVASNIYNRTKI